MARRKGPRPPAGTVTSHSRSWTRSLRPDTRPEFRLFGKLVLTRGGPKEYLPATPDDQAAYRECSATLCERKSSAVNIRLPTLALEDGYNTRQAMSYAFRPGGTSSTIASSWPWDGSIAQSRGSPKRRRGPRS